MYGDAIKICVTAPPVENKANGAILVFLAKLFGIPRSALQIKSGKQGRNKQVIITGLSLAQAQKTLEETLQAQRRNA